MISIGIEAKRPVQALISHLYSFVAVLMVHHPATYLKIHISVWMPMMVHTNVLFQLDSVNIRWLDRARCLNNSLWVRVWKDKTHVINEIPKFTNRKKCRNKRKTYPVLNMGAFHAILIVLSTALVLLHDIFPQLVKRFAHFLISYLKWKWKWKWKCKK